MTHLYLMIAIVTLTASAGCKQQQAEADPAPSPRTAARPEAMSTHAETALRHYEAIRASLADDSTASIANEAKELAAAAEEARERGGPHAPRFEALAKAARALADSPMDDIEKVRLAFGELSRATVGVIAAAPALAEGRHVFRCPMAKGYQKWVQTDEKMANPYMGKKMLACGSRSDWT